MQIALCVFLGGLTVLFITGCWSHSIGSLSPFTNLIDPTLLQSKLLPSDEIAFIDKTNPFIYKSDGITHFPFLQLNLWMSGVSLWCRLYDFGGIHSTMLHSWCVIWSVFACFYSLCVCVYTCLWLCVCLSACVSWATVLTLLLLVNSIDYYWLSIDEVNERRPEWWCHSLR